MSGAPPPPPPPPPPVDYGPPQPPGYPPSSFPPPYYVAAPPPPPPGQDHTVLIIVVVVVVAVAVVLLSVLAAGLFAISFVSRNLAVHVTEITYSSPDGACGITNFTNPDEWVMSSGEGQFVTQSISNSNLSSSCEIRSVVSSTGGFTVSGANVPLSILAGSEGYLTYEFTPTIASYTGSLAIVLD